MPWLTFHEDADNVAGFGNEGATTWFRANTPAGHAIPQLSEIGIMAAGGVGCSYNGRLYVTNQYTDNVLVDEHLRLHRLGITAPDVVPVLASGGGGPISGLSGLHIGYVSFYDILTNERSSLSAASVEFDNVAGANAITWTSLPTSAPGNARVTHIELWRSVDGGAIRFVGRRTIGTTTATEQIPTLALGEVAPDFFERFPPCKMNAMYHDRMFLAGDRQNPDTLYASAMFFPERFEGLTFRTRNGEPITAIINVRDMLLVCCPSSSYILQGYSEDDAVFSMSEPELGAINMRGVKLAHGNAIIPNSKSIYLFNGSWHNIMPDSMDEWRRCYDLFPEEFEAGFGIFSPAEDIYKFCVTNILTQSFEGIQPVFHDFYLPSGGVVGSLYWVGDMRPCVPQLEGTFGQPHWSFDFRQREDLCNAIVAVPGWTRPQCMTGSLGDGYLRLENSTIDFTDDGDFYDNTFSVQTGGYLMGQPGGGPEDGKTLKRLWTYVRSEDNLWEMRVVGGDDEANYGLTAPLQVFNNQIQYRTAVSPSIATTVFDDLEFRAGFKGVHHHVPEKVSGRAFFVMVFAAAPEHVIFRGFGGTWIPGPATRGVALVTLLE